MPSLRAIVTLPVLTLLLSLLGGCGGGSGPLNGNTAFSSASGEPIPATPSGATSPPTIQATPPRSPVLDMALAPRLSASVLDLVTAVTQVGDTSEVVGRSGRSLFAAGLRRRHAAMTNLGLVLGRILNRLGGTPGAGQLVAAPRLLGVHGDVPETFLTLSCEGDASGGTDPFGGSYEIQHFVSDPGRSYFLSGQVLTVNFYACILGGVALDGGLNIADFQYRTVTTGGLAEQLMSGTVSFNGLAMTRPGSTPLTLSTGIGAPLLYQARYRNDRAVATHIETGNLVMSRDHDTVNDLFNGVILDTALDEASGTYSLEVAGDMTSSMTNDGLVLSSPQALAWQGGSHFPSSGVLRMEAAPAILTLTALDASLVQLDLDQDGDGLVDASDTLSWSSLLP